MSLTNAATLPLAEVAPRIWRLSVPVPFTALGAVNCYLLRDADGPGWTALDTGMNTPRGTAAWEAAVPELGLDFAHLRQIVLTHSHPDHFGLAGWLQAKSGGLAPVRLSPREWEIVQMIWIHRSPTRDRDLGEHARRCGAPQQFLDMFRSMPEGNQEVATARAVQPYPELVHPLSAGERIQMGGRDWVAVHTPGHSDGHLLFHTEDATLMIAGDQVLPEITPNIGLWPGIERDPLGRYLASLKELGNYGVHLALPGHGRVMTDFADRTRVIAGHHEERLAKMQQIVEQRGASTVLDVTMGAFDFTVLKPADWPFALVETASHVEYLAQTGRLGRSEDAEGIWKFGPVEA